MLARSLTALGLALLATLATTGVSSAAVLSDRDDVMMATGVVAVVLMGVLLVFYLVRHAIGLDKMAPPEPDSQEHH